MSLPARKIPPEDASAAAETLTARRVRRGKEVLLAEMSAIEAVRNSLDQHFASAVDLLLHCSGSVVVSGMGKAGIVGKKLAASLSSTGTPAHFMHPAEAVHGDLGSVRPGDVVVLLSYSGETEEITRLVSPVRHRGANLLAITSKPGSTLALAVDCAILLGEHREACSLGLAPTCTTTAMLAVCDALTLVVSENRGFTSEQFAQYHPAGSLGKQLTRVEEVMRPLSECRLASQNLTVRQVLIHVGRPGRRTGAIMLCHDDGRLAGIFTDSDLARLLETSHESQLDQPISQVMTVGVQTVTGEAYLPVAMQRLIARKLSELPVVDTNNIPLGILDITDVLSVTQKNAAPSPAPAAKQDQPKLRILSLSCPETQSRAKAF